MTASVRIDHVVYATTDLSAAGTHNRIVPLCNGIGAAELRSP